MYKDWPIETLTREELLVALRHAIDDLRTLREWERNCAELDDILWKAGDRLQGKLGLLRKVPS